MRTFALLATAALIVSPALADWNEGDPYKMHYPQMPDPGGWDVDFTSNLLADDWMCIESGPVTDVHFWYSWQGDLIGEIESIGVSIHENIPDPNPDDPDTFSMPGPELWFREFLLGEFTTRFWGDGQQGYLYPPDEAIPNDHFQIWQCNIIEIVEPFFQERDQIYWLDLSVTTTAGTNAGWKTSMSPQFMDDAVYLDPTGGFRPLFDPRPPHESLDMAFVITPEPAAFLLILAGATVALRRRD